MKKNIALITGASRGIGIAIARELASSHEIIAGGSSEESVATICAELSAQPFVADLSDSFAIAREVETIDSLDLLIHNAGVADTATLAEATPARWRKIFDVNLFAVAELTRLLLPKLRRSSGKVIIINSGSGFFTTPGNGIYAASKFALRAFSDTLRKEEPAIRVISIHPGRVDTDMQKTIQAHRGRPYNPQEHMRAESVAAAVRFAVDLPLDANIDEVQIRPAPLA